MASLRELLVTIETKLNEPALKEVERRLNKAVNNIEKKMQKLGDVGDRVGGVLTGVFAGLAIAIPTAT